MSQLFSKEDGTVFFNNCPLALWNLETSRQKLRLWDCDGRQRFEHWQQRRIPVERQNLGLHLGFSCFFLTYLNTTMVGLTGIAWNCGTAAFWAHDNSSVFSAFFVIEKKQGSGTVAMMSLSDASCSISTQRNRLGLSSCCTLLYPETKTDPTFAE